jgi:hypothetical protein
MFLCEKCHEQANCDTIHLFRSLGRCEYCYMTTYCFDCKTYDFRSKEERLRRPKDWKQQVDSDGLFNPDVPNYSEDV